MGIFEIYDNWIEMMFFIKRLIDFGACVLIFYFGSFLAVYGWAGFTDDKIDPFTDAANLTMMGLGATTSIFAAVVGCITLIRTAIRLTTE